MESLENIVARAQSGDAEAYEIIFQRFKGMAFSYAYSILGDYQLAEDAKQEAFLGAYCDLLALRDPAAFPGWFRTIVRKHSIQIKRGRKTLDIPLEDASEIHSNDPNPALQAQSNELTGNILWSIRQLPEHERDITHLFYMRGNSLKEISSLINLPEKTIKSRLFSARARLRQRLMGMVKESIRNEDRGSKRRLAQQASAEAVREFEKDLDLLLKTPTSEDFAKAADLICAKGRLQRFMGEMQLALQTFQEGIAFSGFKRDPILRIRLRAEIGLTYVQLSDYAQAGKELLACKKALAKTSPDSPLMACVCNGLGICAWGRGRLAEARGFYETTAGICRKSKIIELEAEAKNNLALLDWKSGYLEKANQGFQYCLKLWKKAKNRFGQALSLMNAGIIEENMGRNSLAQKNYEKALELARELNFIQLQSACCCNLSNLGLISQRWSIAAEYAMDAQKLAREIGDRRSEAIALENLACAHTGMGAFADVRRALRKARSISSDIGDMERIGSLRICEAELHIAQGKYAKANTALEEAMELASKNSFDIEVPRILRLKAYVQRQMGNLDKAILLFQSALDEARKHKNRVEEKKIMRLVGRIGDIKS